MQANNSLYYTSQNNPTKFYTWNNHDFNYSFRNWSNEFIVNINEPNVVAFFKHTRPVTVRNYFEGGNGKTIEFGEIGFDFLTRQSPHNTNAFIYNPPDVPAFYKAEAYSSHQNLFGTNWTFQNWENGSTNLTREEQITPSSFTEWKAMYKGVSRTDNSTALANPSQRKFVRTTSGNMYSVYESMGKIWLESSTNDGVTWILDNGGAPISQNFYGEIAKNPSLDYSTWQDLLVIAYEETHASDEVFIKAAFIFPGGSASSLTPVTVGETIPGMIDLNPVVSVVQKSKRYADVAVIWSDPGIEPTYRSKGIYYRLFELSETGSPIIEQYYNQDNGANFLPGSNFGTPGNATMQAIKTVESGDKSYHIAWQEWTTKIKYSELILSSSGSINIQSSPDLASLNSGYDQNYFPSIIVLDDNIPRLTWIGEREAPSYEKKVILRGKTYSGVWNSTMWKYGSNVNAVSMNTNETGTIGGYGFAWSQGSTAPYSHYSVVNTRINYSPRNICEAEGKFIHLCNGASVGDMFVTGLNNTGLPYSLVLSDNITEDHHSCGGIEKVTTSIIQSVGREGLISYDNNLFYFELSNIILNGEVIEFEPLEDTTTFNDQISLNNYLESKPFEIDDNSSLNYSVEYGVLLKGQELIFDEGEYVNFKVQLVDNNTGETIGTYDNITFDSENIERYNNIDYNILSNGIGKRTAKMRLVVEYNIDAAPNLSTIFSATDLLAKESATTILFNGEPEVTSYDLAQNYPNPFNPTTTIKYQLPNAGNVTLKIYDVLGSEVMTLVNTMQSEGRYEVKFDASQLSSGVYIYRIQANDYVASRKMILMK